MIVNYRIALIFLLLINQFLRISSLRKPNNKKRQENLCPNEYEACWCEYINSNNLDTGKDQVDFTSSSSSIMINCHHYLSSEMDQKKSKPLKFLNEIPKINTTVTNKKKLLSSVTHLDLSRTEISEIPTDAFQGLNGLQTIVVEYCKNLTIIRMFAFRNLPHLKTLIISNNPNLVDLEPHAFGGLKNLNFLSLVNNRLTFIDGYIFSTSSSIKIIDFIGNPIKKIKSHAFDGLRNVTDLLLSMEQKTTPIETIEGDAFISTAFVDQIYLDGIPAKVLNTNAFRGLSYCRNLHLSNTHLEEIESNAFLRTNNVKKINFKNSRLKYVNRDAFRGIFNIEEIDLRGNYLTRVNQSSFEQLISSGIAKKDKSLVVTESIRIIDFDHSHNFIVNKILLEQNPIQCDCNLIWVLKNKTFQDYLALPEICAGPKGYDCLRVNDLKIEDLACRENENNQNLSKFPCEDLVFDVDKNLDMYLISEKANKANTEIESQTAQNKITQNLTEEVEEEIDSEESMADENKSEILNDDDKSNINLNKILIMTTRPKFLEVEASESTSSASKRNNKDTSLKTDLTNQSLGLSNSSNRFHNNKNIFFSCLSLLLFINFKLFVNF